MHITLDSVSNDGWYELQGSVIGGEYTGVSDVAFDAYTASWTTLDSLSSGRKIYVCAELLPIQYHSYIGTLTHDYSNIIEVTVP